ncbi:DUF4829 domain-containing protein [Clostridium sp.]|uniref:DUF4829 domain-containing protein n=1 Tax=Clostridium sp. TaxID=1506 RepID=UPI002FC6A4E7
MKKIVSFICLILVVVSLVGCKQSGATDNVTVDVGESTKFTKKEINKAIDSVINNFRFPACTLTKVWYDEEKSNIFVKGYMSNGRGRGNGVSPENVIILLSNFDVDGSGNNPVLDPNSTYTEYQWILIRDSKTSEWKIDDQGY